MRSTVRLRRWPSTFTPRVVSFGLALTVVVAGILGTQSGFAQTYKVIHTFSGKDGASPRASLIRDQKGNLYGTAFGGGDLKVCAGLGCGVVFKLDKNGKQTILHAFTGGRDGANPNGPLVLDASGNLYGTASSGGDLSCPNQTNGCGLVFKVDAAGSETVLYAFVGGVNVSSDGEFPSGSLALDDSGNIFGTTQRGGDIQSGDDGYGTMFLIHAGTESVMFRFVLGGTGGIPVGGLARSDRGILYGTASIGGQCNDPGCGVVFQVKSDGTFRADYAFGETDGATPYAAVLPDTHFDLYGTTSGGGAAGYGTVFKVRKVGRPTENVLHSFAGYPSDGANPYAGLVRDKDGNFYGTTVAGGTYNLGTVFKLSKKTETVLYSFTGGADGASPYGGLVMDGNGNLYGTAISGGDLNCSSPSGCGVVFKLSP